MAPLGSGAIGRDDGSAARAGDAASANASTPAPQPTNTPCLNSFFIFMGLPPRLGLGSLNQDGARNGFAIRRPLSGGGGNRSSAAQFLTNDLSRRLREGCASFRSALASIC